MEEDPDGGLDPYMLSKSRWEKSDPKPKIRKSQPRSEKTGRSHMSKTGLDRALKREYLIGGNRAPPKVSENNPKTLTKSATRFLKLV